MPRDEDQISSDVHHHPEVPAEVPPLLSDLTQERVGTLIYSTKFASLARKIHYFVVILASSLQVEKISVFGHKSHTLQNSL